MSELNPPGKRENTYFIDPESGAEMARLIDQDQLITRYMGGLFSEFATDEISSMHRILDIACGPGGWPQEVAFTYREKEVVAFDISKAMIDYARAMARVKKLTNVTFHVMDALEPLEFSDESFDMVNARFLGFMLPSAWPQLMQECLRILRPGGFIRLAEAEWTLTNSPAHDTIARWLYQALKQAGQSFSPSGQLGGLVPMLGSFLRQAGYQDIQQTPYVIDYSYGTPAYEGFRRDVLIGTKLYQPFVVNMGVTTAETFDHTYEQMQEEIATENYRALMFILTARGTKPR